MIKGSELIGLSVVKDNRIGINYYVTGLIFSEKASKLLALQVKSKSRSNKHDKMIPYRKIENITDRNVIISSKNDLIYPDQIPEIDKAWKNPTKILGFHIYNHLEELVGVIKDVIIQKSSGKIIAFVISEGIYDDLLKGYSLLPVLNSINLQNDCIIIGENELKSIFNHGGGLKKILGIE